MKLLRVIPLVLGLALSEAKADISWNPFTALPAVVDWFKQLDGKFDTLVTAENQKQLLRSVDKIRLGTYSLEQDSRALLLSIPDEQPNKTERQEIQAAIDTLLGTIQELRQNLRTLGADLRLEGKGGAVAEQALSIGYDGKGAALMFVSRELQRDWTAASPWNPKLLREKLDAGLKSVKSAQEAVTDFQKKFSRFDEPKR